MHIIHKGTIHGGQDGAIFGNLLFRFENRGQCHIYDLADETLPEIGQFRLDRWEEICPHSNSVFFGNEYFAPGDPFPLLYSNIYNNHAKDANRLEGVCCVYRVCRTEAGFENKLVQLLRVDFVDDDSLWGIGDNIRPYGNFIADTEKGILYAFTMRDQDQITRYFAFPMPKHYEGKPESISGVPVRALTKEDILFSFDCPYHHFIQGSCVHKGLIYSLEGFTNNQTNPPAFRVIDPQARSQKDFILCADLGITVEPECIDFLGDQCWYSDVDGELFNLIF